MSACGICGGAGFTDHEDQAGTLVPCKRCRTKAFDKWTQGKYSSTHDREAAMEAARRPVEEPVGEPVVW